MRDAEPARPTPETDGRAWQSAVRGLRRRPRAQEAGGSTTPEQRARGKWVVGAA